MRQCGCAAEVLCTAPHRCVLPAASSLAFTGTGGVQGKLEVRTLAGTGAAADKEEDVVQKIPFLLLSLDLPPARLFQDALESDIIPQARSPPALPTSRRSLSHASPHCLQPASGLDHVRVAGMSARTIV